MRTTGFAAVLVVTMLAGGTALAAEPVPARPLGNIGAWVTTADYPASALRNSSQGTVQFVLAIDTAGKVKTCTVTGSSGSEALDSKTCALLMERARFAPARDAQGGLTEGTYTNRVRWTLPEDRQLPTPGELEISFVVGADGSASSCANTRRDASGAVVETSTVCPPRSFEPYRDAAGKPRTARVRIVNKITIEPTP